MKPYASPIMHMSYWEFFQNNYASLIKNMDLILKTTEPPIPVSETAKALALSVQEVEKIMSKEEITQIDGKVFLHIMMNGTSPLCRLMQREYMCGSPTLYSPAHIAYIYELIEEHVVEVCQAHGYTEVPANALPDLLSKIYIFILPQNKQNN